LENKEISSEEVIEKLKELKIKGTKKIKFLNFPSTKTANTLLYVDDSILKVRTLIKIDGSLEIFIEREDH
jgi:hypothetical protein